MITHSDSRYGTEDITNVLGKSKNVWNTETETPHFQTFINITAALKLNYLNKKIYSSMFMRRKIPGNMDIFKEAQIMVYESII